MSIETLPPLAQPIYARLVSAAVDALEDGESVTAEQWLAMRTAALGEALASFRLPALPRPPQLTRAQLGTLMDAELAASWARIGNKKIPYDAPGSSAMERAWRKLRGQRQPQLTHTKAEP